MKKPIYKMTMQEKLDYYHQLPEDEKPYDYARLRKTNYPDQSECIIVSDGVDNVAKGTKVTILNSDLHSYLISSKKDNIWRWVKEDDLIPVSALYNETDLKLRQAELADLIQRNYDADNWGTPGKEHRALLTIAAQIEYIGIVGTKFTPEYNCPA